MSRGPDYSILFSAPVVVSAGDGSAGDILIESEDEPGRFTLATSASRGTRRSIGIAMTAYVAGGSVRVQQNGVVDSSIVTMGAGAASPLRVSTIGRLERVSAPDASDDVIAYCDETGQVWMYPGLGQYIRTLAGSGVRPGDVLATAYSGVHRYDSIAEAQAGLDSTAGFQEAIDAMGPVDYASRGSTLFIPAGYYRISGVLYVRRAGVIEASGTWGRLSGSMLCLDAGAYVWVQDLGDTADGGRADMVTFKNIHFRGPGAGVGAAVDGGVKCEVGCHFEECSFVAFNGCGAWMEGSGGTTNANQSSFRFCYAEDNASHGFYVGGGDASMVMYLHCYSVTNGGAGFFDTCFLGNHYLNCHTIGNALRGYHIEGGTNATLLSHCYAELDQPPSLVESPSMMISGNIYAGGFAPSASLTGLRINHAANISPFRVFNESGSVDVSAYPAGAEDGSNRIHEFTSSDDYAEFGTAYVVADKHWLDTFENTSAVAGLVRTGGLNKRGPNRVGGPRGLMFGVDNSATNLRTVRYAAAAPTTGLWERGDFAFDETATNIGWQCNATGGWGATWAATTRKRIGDAVVPTVGNGKVYRCVSGAGSTFTGSSEPTWPTVIGNTVVDGDVTWECFGVTPATFTVR